MLCELRVKNLALIESLELGFEQEGNSNLVVMTGETGAGKSIMLRAIHLLAGKRGASEWIREGTDQCEVEALFEIASDHKTLRAKLSDAGFGEERTVVIRRLLNRNRGSRYYINASLTTGRFVSEVMAEMLNVASQHDQQALLQSTAHLDFIDTIGGLWSKREELTKVRSRYLACKEKLSLLLQEEQEKEQRKDFLKFQIDEICAAAPEPGEDEELLAEKKRLKNSQNLIGLSQESYRLLEGELMAGLSQLRQNLAQIAALDEGAEQLSENISGFTFLAEDYAQDLRRYRDSLESDPYRMDQVSERLDLLQQLKRKYGESIDSVLEFKKKGEEELNHLENMDREIGELRVECERLEEQLIHQADELTGMRYTVGKSLEKAMEAELASLAFDQPTFQVIWNEVDKHPENIRASGWERGEFYFSANRGERAKPLARVASGGELSRLMLAMKCLLAKKDKVETVIFDEIDTGIGGEAAEAVARKIQELSSHHQVFCITHLPQIACRGTLHYLVSKSVSGDRTQSEVHQLSQSQRVGELERMLAGDSATNQTRAWAEELLEKGQAA